MPAIRLANTARPFRGIAVFLSAALSLAALTGCHQDMWDQPRLEALERSEFFDDGVGSRMPVENTVQYGMAMLDDHYYTGMVNGEFAMELPPQIEVNAELLERGRERYEIFCSMCHGLAGYGNGMIISRGFKEPTSYHYDPESETPRRLLEAGPGYFFDVITNGFGTMYSYAGRVPVEDRWAIAAYIKVLQRSQNVPPGEVPAEYEPQLEGLADVK